jgi:hypothetical protein
LTNLGRNAIGQNGKNKRGGVVIMKLSMKQLRKLIREAKRSIGDVAFSGKYFDVKYSAKGYSAAKDMYVITHRSSRLVIPTSMYSTQLREVKSLVKLIERSIGPSLGNPDLESDFHTLHAIYSILKDWPKQQVGRR